MRTRFVPCDDAGCAATAGQAFIGALEMKAESRQFPFMDIDLWRAGF